jgi:hypothetical protein
LAFVIDPHQFLPGTERSVYEDLSIHRRKSREVHSLPSKTFTMLSAVARYAVRRPVAGARTMTTSLEQFEDYGKSAFTGKVADEYLTKHGGSGAMLKDPTWVNNHADTVAFAVFDW